METKLNLLGPQGVQQRMADIRARMEGVIGRRDDGFRLPTEATSELSGEIGATGGFAPLQINAPGVEIQGPDRGTIQNLINQAASENDLEPELLDALVAVESSYNPFARSHAGAMGLTQLMPDTAKMLGVTNPFDPAQNLKGGAAYLNQLLSQFGDLPTALAAYNAGPGAVNRAGGIPPYKETQNYVSKVMSLYNQRKA